MSVAICIDGVAMRRQRDARDQRDDGALDHIWHHDAAEQLTGMAAASPGVCIHSSRTSLSLLLHAQGFNSAASPWPIAVTSVSESLSMSHAGSGCSLGPGVLPHVSLPHQSCGTALCLYRVLV
jgi:hypothetical protein